MARIADGSGRGFEAAVDSTNRLLVESIALNIREEAVLEGASFELGGLVTLTGTSETAVIFVENQQDRTIVLDRFEFSSPESTGGTSDAMLLTLYTGPSAITNSTPGGVGNSNFGSALAIPVDVQLGNGSTSAVTGGSAFGSSYVRLVGQSMFNGPWAVPRGNTFALTATPPAGNTSLPFTVRVLTHLERSE